MWQNDHVRAQVLSPYLSFPLYFKYFGPFGVDFDVICVDRCDFWPGLVLFSTLFTVELKRRDNSAFLSSYLVKVPVLEAKGRWFCSFNLLFFFLSCWCCCVSIQPAFRSRTWTVFETQREESAPAPLNPNKLSSLGVEWIHQNWWECVS